MKRFKKGDVIHSALPRPNGTNYEVVNKHKAVHSGNYCCPAKYWDREDITLVGNVKDNPELSCKGRPRFND